MSQTLDLDRLKRFIEKDYNAKTVIIVLSEASLGFGFTETELIGRTGISVQELRECLSLLQYYGAVEVRCTQVGTAGPYDYFFHLQNVEVEVTVKEKNKPQV